MNLLNFQKAVAESRLETFKYKIRRKLGVTKKSVLLQLGVITNIGFDHGPQEFEDLLEVPREDRLVQRLRHAAVLLPGG